MLIFIADSLDGRSNLSHKVHGYAIIPKSGDLIRSTSKCLDLGQVLVARCASWTVRKSIGWLSVWMLASSTLQYHILDQRD